MRQRQWAVVVPVGQFDAERLTASEEVRVHLPEGAGEDGPWPGDRVALIADTEPRVLFGLGRVTGFRYGSRPAERTEPDVSIRYERRLLDAPAPLAVPGPPGVSELTGDGYAALAALVPAVNRYLVSVSLPIEAASPAEAVREFWSYLDTLGPGELPAFVSPAGDELAMQAFVLGTEANLDPEE